MKKKRCKLIKIDTDQILLKARNLFIFDEIDEFMTKRIVMDLLALDKLNHKNINIWINSCGGSVTNGLAIIDTFIQCKSVITTIIIGGACSMAGIISIMGNVRLMTKNSVWMAHDMSGGISGGDYISKVKFRTNYLMKEQKQLYLMLKEHTDLSGKQLSLAKAGELWLFAKECIKFKLVDRILEK